LAGAYVNNTATECELGDINANITANVELQCEECIKYWSHLLGSSDAFRDFINDLAEAINSINFDFAPLSSPPTTTCTLRTGNNALVTGDNPDPNVRCIPIAASGQEQNLAHVYELCKQLELAIEYIASENSISITAAFELFATQFINTLGGPGCTNTDCKTARGLLECLRERVVPLLQEEQNMQQQSTSQENPNSEIQMTNPTQQTVSPFQRTENSLTTNVKPEAEIPTVSESFQALESSLQENSLTTNVKPEAGRPTVSEKMSPPPFSPPTIAQGIGGSSSASSSALEKTTKLKQQWLGLLP
jgi:hypothetical protein